MVVQVHRDEIKELQKLKNNMKNEEKEKLIDEIVNYFNTWVGRGYNSDNCVFLSRELSESYELLMYEFLIKDGKVDDCLKSDDSIENNKLEKLELSELDLKKINDLKEKLNSFRGLDVSVLDLKKVIFCFSFGRLDLFHLLGLDLFRFFIKRIFL